MGWTNVFYCEREPFAQRVLAHYWPESKLYEDVTTFDATKYRGTIDVLTGGFPCQPYSTAGKRLGKDDERHLWPQMLRIIREIAPRYVVGENVNGLVSWSDGLVFEEVCLDLEAKGYEVQPYVLPASAVGAPHERKRVWFVAYSKDVRNNRGPAKICGTERRPHSEQLAKPFERGEIWYATNADHGSRPSNAVRAGRQEFTLSPWTNFPIESPICGGNDGLPTELDGITFPKWRNESIKGYGNAVVPQLVYEIFQAIQAHEKAKDQAAKGNSQTR